MEERKALAQVALGQAPADVVIRGGQLVNVHTGEIYPAGVAIKGTRIAAVGDVDGTIGPDTEVIDARGAYLCPGFIDTHIHVGGSQLSMTELARLLVSRGTAAISTDFYESGMIGGVQGMRFLADELARTPLRALFTPFIASYLCLGPLGNTQQLSGDDLVGLLDWPEIVGVREWQHHSVGIPDDAVQKFLETAVQRRLVIDGHLEKLKDADLQASIALGAMSDHEMGSLEEVLDRIRLGAHPLVRWGSSTWDLEPIIRGVVRDNIPTDRLAFCTDEQDAVSLARDGHMDHKIRMAIQCGLDPVKAVQMATINAARFERVDQDLGSIAPGRLAYVVFVPDLKEFVVDRVVANGRLVAEGGRYIAPLSQPEYPSHLYGTVRLQRALAAEDFAVRAPEGLHEVRVRLIRQTEGNITPESQTVVLPVREGNVALQPGIAKVAVIDRHLASGRMGVGFVEGFGIRAGAVASSFNPGICNLAVMGVDDGDMALAANRVAELGGGFVVARGGRIVAEAPLPLHGLYSDKPLAQALSELEAVDRALRDELGSPFRGFMVAFGFLCLGVTVPGLKITEQGLVEIKDYRVEKVSVFV